MPISWPSLPRLPRVWDMGPEDRLFRPSAEYGGRPTNQILILQQGPNPTTEYYLRPRLPDPERIPTTLADLSADPATVPIAPGTFLIIVRYLNTPWARHLMRQRDRLSGAAFLMDDDLPAAWRASHLPLRYRWKIQRLFLAQRPALAALCDRIWVGSEALAEKYPDSGATHLPPLPLPSPPVQADPTRPVTYFYHGTASHGPEHRWVSGIVRAVQAESRDLIFITIGGSGVRKHYAGIPRVLVLHPLSWPDYLGALPALPHHIGLAPLLDTPFNRGRSHTKFFDITRLGAAGIYSDCPPYGAFVRDGGDGILLGTDPDAWRRTILGLARSSEQRMLILQEAVQRCDRLTSVVPSPSLFDMPA